MRTRMTLAGRAELANAIRARYAAAAGKAMRKILEEFICADFCRLRRQTALRFTAQTDKSGARHDLSGNIPREASGNKIT
jgi:hypothetical protein